MDESEGFSCDDDSELQGATSLCCRFHYPGLAFTSPDIESVSEKEEDMTTDDRFYLYNGQANASCHTTISNISKDSHYVRSACTEENELLSATSIKMSDAPFGRSDSEDEIIEDYDDVLTFKAPCLNGRTPLEKFLLLLLFISLVIIIGLAVGLTRPQVVPVTKYCKSSACVQASSSLISSIDWRVNPCNDFYQFACGQWLRTTPIPHGYQRWDRFQELSGYNLYVLSNLIESSSQTGASFNKTKGFYQSCLSSSKGSREHILKEFEKMIDDTGGWTFSSQDIYHDKWDYMYALEKVHRMGAWPLFRLDIEEDERDPTVRNIIKLDIGETVLPPDLKVYVNESLHNATSPDDLPASLRDAEKLKELFQNETVHIMMSFGATKAQALDRAEKMAKLEDIILTASQGYHHIHDRFSLYNVMTIKDLELNYTMLNWMQYFTALGFNVVPETEVVVRHPDYMKALTSSLKTYHEGSVDNKKTIRDYFIISLLRSFKPYFANSLFEIDENEDDEMEDSWKRCTFYTNKALSFATGALYVKGTESEDSVEKMEKLIVYVKNAFKDYLLGKYWMNRRTRVKAEKKVDAIIDKISYPSYIMNGSFLDNYYQAMDIFPDWFSNLLSWRRFLLANMNQDLDKKPDRKSSWLKPPVTVNAHYSATRNDVIFPIAMFHLPFYIPDGPSAVNFGAMGSIIGHEITHAFDYQGRQYDGQGRLTDWWDEQTNRNFETTTPCMKDQYSRMKVKGVHIDGDFTLDENIADNGGLRAAIYAYQMWIEEFGEELQLPGLNMTMYQAFFTSYAQMFCSKWTDTGLFLHMLRDPHSPGVARVNGALSNSQTFNWAFRCPMDSKMNPRIKCEVW